MLQQQVCYHIGDNTTILCALSVDPGTFASINAFKKVAKTITKFSFRDGWRAWCWFDLCVVPFLGWAFFSSNLAALSCCKLLFFLLQTTRRALDLHILIALHLGEDPAAGISGYWTLERGSLLSRICTPSPIAPPPPLPSPLNLP